MKNYLIAFVIIFAVIKSHAQDMELENSRLYEIKVNEYAKRKLNGKILMGLGTVSSIGGIALIAKGVKIAEDSNQGINSLAGRPQIFGGLLFTAFGITTLITGTVLAITCNKKQKQYQSKLDNLRLGYYQSSGANGISLVYTF